MVPEHIPRPIGSYDPNEPLIIPYGDLIAARNAVAHLVTILRDQAQPPSEYQKQSIATGVRIAVTRPGEPYMFDTFDEAMAWLIELRDRLGQHLPTLPSGPREYGSN